MMNKSFASTYLDLYLTYKADFYKNNREYIHSGPERLVLYEIYKRYRFNEHPINLNWIEKTLGVTFPTSQKIAKKLATIGYLTITQSAGDKRNKELRITKKLINGIEAFETFKASQIKTIRGNKLKIDSNIDTLFKNEFENFTNS